MDLFVLCFNTNPWTRGAWRTDCLASRDGPCSTCRGSRDSFTTTSGSAMSPVQPSVTQHYSLRECRSTVEMVMMNFQLAISSYRSNMAGLETNGAKVEVVKLPIGIVKDVMHSIAENVFFCLFVGLRQTLTLTITFEIDLDLF